MQFNNWKPRIIDLGSAIALIQSYFGKEWLEEQKQIFLEKPKDSGRRFTHHLKPKPHPIVPLYFSSLRNYHRLKSNLYKDFNMNSLKLISFYESLENVKKIKVVELNGNKLKVDTQQRFKKRLLNKNEFDQAAYEIQIALALARKGFATSFIEESSKPKEKTPDIQVVYKKQKFYVECKYQGLTKREKQYRNMFNEFYWRSMSMMFRLGEFYLVCVEWLRDPVLKDVVSLIKLLKEKIEAKQTGTSQTETAKLWLDHLSSGNQTFRGPFKCDIGKYRSDDEHVDVVLQQAHAGIFNGVVKHKCPTLIMFRNISYLDDLVNGAIQDINKAYSQIPKGGPSVVFLENRTSFLDEKIEKFATDLQNRVRGKLNLISRVNRVILTKSYFARERVIVDGRIRIAITRKVESRVIDNQKPATSLLQDTLKRMSGLKYY